MGVSVPSPVYATVSWRRSPATIVPSETTRRLRRCQPPLRLLVFSNRQPERWFGRRRLEQRRKTEKKPRRSAVACKGMMSHERCAKKDGDGQMRMDAGMAGVIYYLASYSSFSVVFMSRSRLLPRVFRALSLRDAAPLFSPPRCALRSALCALCDALSAPAKIRSPPAFSPLLPLFHHPHVSLDSDRLQKRGGGGAIRMRGASFRNQRQRRRSRGRRTLLPAILLSGCIIKRVDTPKT